MTIYGTKDATYNNQNLGAYQGADFMFFNNTVVAVTVMESFFKSMTTLTLQATTGDSTLALSLFSPVHGTHQFSAATGWSKCSMKLGLPTAGMKLVLDFLNFVGDANISIMASEAGGVTGVSLVDGYGKKYSTIMISAVGRAELMCYTDGTWTIGNINGSVTPQAGA